MGRRRDIGPGLGGVSHCVLISGCVGCVAGVQWSDGYLQDMVLMVREGAGRTSSSRAMGYYVVSVR